MMTKVAICGKMGSGKTTLCELIRENIESRKQECTILSFAQPIKDIAIKYFGMVEKNRNLLIKIGQFGRSIDKDLWIKHLLRVAEKNENSLCDDLRQYNEHKALRENKWYIIKLVISPELQKKRLIQKYGEQQTNDHMQFGTDCSEMEAVNLPDTDFDMVIKMDEINTIEDMKEIANNILQNCSCLK